jgi:hypothetical protein
MYNNNQPPYTDRGVISEDREGERYENIPNRLLQIYGA